MDSFYLIFSVIFLGPARVGFPLRPARSHVYHDGGPQVKAIRAGFAKK